MRFAYTATQLVTQRTVVERSLQQDQDALSNLHKVPSDVRANHERTIRMRIRFYEGRIERLNAQLQEVSA